MSRDEISNLETERDGILKQLGKQKDETEKVRESLREEKKNTDKAALEIATLTQKVSLGRDGS